MCVGGEENPVGFDPDCASFGRAAGQALCPRERERARLAGCTTVMDRVGGGAGIEWQGVNDGSGAQAVPVMKGPPSEET